ncbi:MAG: TRAP transporter small permease [Deltaproteobacteria bacterium]|nr:TRAP transporter small permease [Deltaproteobacteria bacterium]
MEIVDKIVKRVSGALNWVAGAAVTFMMLLTVTDILLRAGGRPITGTFEVVSLLLGIVIAFGIPQVSLDRGHVNMDFLLDRLTARGRQIMNTLTRLACLILFAFIGGNLFNVAARFKAGGEVSATIQLPFYPIAYGVAICCLLECCLFAYEIAKIWRQDHA